MLEITGILLYALIFLARTIEMALATLRLILVSNGKKMAGAILLFINVIIWIALVSVVLDNISGDPFKVLVYAVASLVGSYLGGIIEEKLAIGENVVMAIVEYKSGEDLANKLRENNFAVTTMQGKGIKENKTILMVAAKRKSKQAITKIIKRFDSNAVVMIEAATEINGGYVR